MKGFSFFFLLPMSIFTVFQLYCQPNNDNAWVELSNLLHVEPCRRLDEFVGFYSEQIFEFIRFNLPSSTPKPNRWLNSSPAPLICHKCCLDGSNNWLRFAVRTVMCWTSLQVNWRLKKNHLHQTWYIYLIHTWLQALMRIHPLLRELLQMYRNVSKCIARINRLLPLLIKQNRHLLFDFSRVFHNRRNYITKETISSVLHAMLFSKWDLIYNNKENLERETETKRKKQRT